MSSPDRTTTSAGNGASMTDTTALPVTPEDFLQDFHHASIFGATANSGLDRQAGTKEHGQVRDWFQRRAESFGFEVKTDSIGNIFALKTWVPGARYVLAGSHLDSQPLGGRFDGTYGVIAALHAAVALDQKVTAGRLSPHVNIAVVDWFNEEGARFLPSIMGSSVYTGLLDLETALKAEDPAHVSVAEALEATGRRGGDAVDIPTAAYAEIHIEQGSRLERAGVPIGIVDRSWFVRQFRVSVIGEQSHTGATLIRDRRDALVAASHIVVYAEQIAQEFDPDSVVTSVGKFDVYPNSPVVVPGRVEFTVDLRGDRKEDVERMRELLASYVKDLAAKRDIVITADDYDVRPVQRFPIEGIEIGKNSARDEGHEFMVLATQAGHDSIPMNRITPAIMFFVPSEDGISHSEREFTSDEDMLKGLGMFTNALGRIVKGELESVSPGGSLPS